MPIYKLAIDVYDDPKGDGLVLGRFLGTDDSFIIRAEDEDGAVEAAERAIVGKHGHAWVVNSVYMMVTEPVEGETIAFNGGEGPVTGTVSASKEHDGELIINAVSGEGPSRTSWVVAGGTEMVVIESYAAGDAYEFYDRDNIPFPGEVIEVDADGTLYVSSRKLTKYVWVDPITRRVTDTSVYDWA